MEETGPGPSLTSLSKRMKKGSPHWEGVVNKPGESTLTLVEENQLVENTNDVDFKSMFKTTANGFAFWVRVKAEHPDIATKALKALLLFPTSYLCEAGFSAVSATKTRLRSKLDIRNTLRVSLSPFAPRLDRLGAEKQVQGSHSWNTGVQDKPVFLRQVAIMCVETFIQDKGPELQMNVTFSRMIVHACK